MKISEILWKAANEHLSLDVNDESDDQSIFSCHAARIATGLGWELSGDHKVVAFMKSLGCRPEKNGFPEQYRDPQGARYAWLMFASMYAEEQGL